MKNTLMVCIGGALGSICRYWVNSLAKRYLPTSFPVNTLLVNIIGSFVIGLLIGYAARENRFSTAQYLLWATGFCGGFTTFSAFAAENIQMIQSGQAGTSLLYIGLSIVLGLLSVWLGLYFAKG